MNQNYNNFMDAVNIVALLIGVENMLENRTQTAQNDVNAANEVEARYILGEIGKRLDAQDAIIKEILEVVKGENAD